MFCCPIGQFFYCPIDFPWAGRDEGGGGGQGDNPLTDKDYFEYIKLKSFGDSIYQCDFTKTIYVRSHYFVISLIHVLLVIAQH